MRKTYKRDHPRTLSALLAWSPRDSAAPAVTDALGTLDWRAFQYRVLCVAAGLRRNFRCFLPVDLVCGADGNLA